jgi:hypothetical protein
VPERRSASDIDPFLVQEHFPGLPGDVARLVNWGRLLDPAGAGGPHTAPSPDAGGEAEVVVQIRALLDLGAEAAGRLRDLGLPTSPPAGLPNVEAAESLGADGLGRLLDAWNRWADETVDVVEHSPVPQAEWGPVLEVLGADELGALIGISPASLRRYQSGERTTPQDVAERLHLVAVVVADLSGSYNDYGIRRWFRRPRTQLDHRAPADIMSGTWSPDDPDVQRVRELAAALVGLGAT